MELEDKIIADILKSRGLIKDECLIKSQQICVDSENFQHYLSTNSFYILVSNDLDILPYASAEINSKNQTVIYSSIEYKHLKNKALLLEGYLQIKTRNHIPFFPYNLELLCVTPLKKKEEKDV